MSDSLNTRLFLLSILSFILCIGLSFLYTIDYKLGLIALLGIIILYVLLINAYYFYLLFISLLSIDGFSVLGNFSITKIIGIILALFLLLKLVFKKESINMKDNFYLYFILFLMGSLASVFGAKDYIKSLFALNIYISLGILYFITRYFLQSVKTVNSTLNVLILSSIILFIITQIFGLSVKETNTWRIGGGIGDPNTFAMYILVLLPLVFYKTLWNSGVFKLLFYAIFTGLLVMLVFTGSRGGALGFLGMASILIYYYGKSQLKRIFFLLFAVVLVLYFFTPDEFWLRFSTIIQPESEKGISTNIRLSIYKAAIKMFIDSPLVGVGFANFRIHAMEYGLAKPFVTHNSYLEILSGGGLLSFIPFALIIIDAWKKLQLKCNYDKNIRDLLICLKASFISFLITGSFISAGHNKILWFLLALISSVYYLGLTQEKSRNIIK